MQDNQPQGMASAPLKGSRFLDPVALVRLKNLGLAARLVVEGLFSGRHRSPRRGFSIEFAEHREYTPGIDPRHLDWKLLARRDRLYVKQYEEQVNLRAYLVLDASASMAYRHGSPAAKIEYACCLAAALAHLMMTQQDSFGLVVCGDGLRTHIPPRQGRVHLRAVLEALEDVRAEGRTDLAGAFNSLAQLTKRRSLVVVISDMLGSAGGIEPILDAVSHLRHRKHEMVVLQTLDRSELTFPFRDAGRIRDIETNLAVEADAGAIRSHYLEQLNGYLDALRGGCLSRDVGYALADTSEPFDRFLATYLGRRARGRAARGARKRF